jgi:hypothetical protein
VGIYLGNYQFVHAPSSGGVVRVEEPALFLERIAQGFGRAKSFGHGLMLIRRTSAT